MELAEIFRQHSTYLIGTLRANRKSNPKEIIKNDKKKVNHIVYVSRLM